MIRFLVENLNAIVNMLLIISMILNVMAMISGIEAVSSALAEEGISPR